MIYEMKSYSHKEIHRDINANKLANAALKSDDFANRVFLVNKQSGEARANGRESEQAHVFSMSGIYIWSHLCCKFFPQYSQSIDIDCLKRWNCRHIFAHSLPSSQFYWNISVLQLGLT